MGGEEGATASPLRLPLKTEAWQGPRLRARQLSMRGSTPRRRLAPWEHAGPVGLRAGGKLKSPKEKTPPEQQKKQQQRPPSHPRRREQQRQQPQRGRSQERKGSVLRPRRKLSRRARGRPPREVRGLRPEPKRVRQRSGLDSRRRYRLLRRRRRLAPRDQVLRERVRRQQASYRAMSASKEVLAWIRSGTRLQRE